MNAYSTMKRLIATLNQKHDNGRITNEAYTATATTYMTRIDVFFGMGRLSDAEYSELMGDFKTF